MLKRGLEVTIAAANGPRSITLSGATDAIERCLVELSAHGIQGRRLKVNCAFHSPAMIPCEATLTKELAGLSPVDGAIPLYSAVDGASARRPQVRRALLGAQHSRACPVRCGNRGGHSGRVLPVSGTQPPSGSGKRLKQCLDTSGTSGAVMGSMRRGQDERATMLTSLGSLYTFGKTIQWKALHPGSSRCVSLPSYPWQRERHWATPASKSATDAKRQTAAEIAWPGRVLRSAFFDGVVVECEIPRPSPDSSMITGSPVWQWHRPRR